SLKSCKEGSRLLTFLVKISRCSFCSGVAWMSANPNTPIATETKPIPSESSDTPKLNRATPELTSVPTRPSSRPRITIAIALMSEPCASTVAAIRPSTISEKYSAGPNFSATSASGGANSAMITVDTQPAKNEPIAAMPSAGPARPWRAIWYPSRQVTTEDESPGTLTRSDGGGQTCRTPQGTDARKP